VSLKVIITGARRWYSEIESHLGPGRIGSKEATVHHALGRPARPFLLSPRRRTGPA
jgi:hypothetical protein